MKIVFTQEAWDDYNYWNRHDKAVLKKINICIRDINKKRFGGLAKPRRLKYLLSEYSSKRITKEHRLIYKTDEESILIISCRYYH